MQNIISPNSDKLKTNFIYLPFSSTLIKIELYYMQTLLNLKCRLSQIIKH